jgi:hypothetical protein
MYLLQISPLTPHISSTNAEFVPLFLRLLPKFVLFTALAHSTNPDILVVSESLITKATKIPEISIPIYHIFRQDRTAKGGEVAIYCRDSLQSSVITIQVCTQTIRASTFKNTPFQKQVSHHCRLLLTPFSPDLCRGNDM